MGTKKLKWGLNPSKPILRFVVGNKNIKDVLDIGSGEGRNAIFLAKEGFNVKAIDSSEKEMEILKKRAEEEKVILDTEVIDISKYKFNKKYDCILSFATLHFLNEQDAKSVIENMKEYTNKEGLNIIGVFTEDNPQKGFPYLFKKNELKSLYSAWDILVYKEVMTPIEKHAPDFKPHRHAVAFIVAKKNQLQVESHEAQSAPPLQ